jgi:pSer/pThr/pTyr-binding forkhead associated (FHA) protein
MPRIVFKKNEHAPLDLSQAVTLGRSAQHSNVVITDNRLSRAHCRFEPHENGWSIVDLESQNGTFLNGRRVREATVKAGDVVTIGACDMVFEETGGPGAHTVMAGIHSQRSQPDIDLADEKHTPATAEKVESTRTVVAPAALVLQKGTLQDKIHPIVRDPFVIGRKNDCALVLEHDGKASGHHAHIRRDGVNFVIEDLGSTNGVVVNGQKIEGPVVLKNGMKVLLGQQLFKFQMQGQPDASSGRTAPAIASADIQARLKPPGQAGETADTRELDDDNEPKTIAATPEEQKALNQEDDKAALSQQIKFKNRSGGLFAIVEILVVIAVAGAVLFAAWTMMKDDDNGAGGGQGDYPPSRDGGLLAANPSFDDVDEGGYAKGWHYIVNGTDSFNLVEGAHGGRYAMQISRFGPANQPSFLVSERVDFTGRGLNVSTYALNSEASADRFGSAIIAVYWFANKRENEPMQITSITARTRMGEWTELTGSAAAPAGARQFAVGLGMAGTQGSVAFDDVTVTQDDSAADWFVPLSMPAADKMTWHISDMGDISLEGAEGQYLRAGRIELFQSAQQTDPLDVLSMLNGPPIIEKSDNMLYVRYSYFDPIAATNAQLSLGLGTREGKTVLTASVQPAGSGSLDKGSKFVTLHILATPAWVPAELVRFEEAGGPPRAYVTELGVGRDPRKEFTQLLSADTATGNRIVAAAGATPTAIARQHQGGRELVLQDSDSLSLVFEPGRDRDALNERVAQVSAVQAGEDQMDRVDRALTIFRDFLYNQNEIASAAAAVDAASKHYGLRLIELRDGINVPEQTRNEQLYRGAMEEAITSADKLRTASQRWDQDAMPMLRAAFSDEMLPRTRESAGLARDSLRELIDLATAFDQLAAVARKSLFALKVAIEQRESEPFMVSARDFLESGQYVQGMVKLRAVVSNYPRCLRGIEAKERMVDVAGILLAEMETHAKQNLKNIARDRALEARELLDLVQKNLLSSLLTDTEKQWLRDPGLPAELRTTEWISREGELLKRMTEMRRKLPADLPPPEDK